MISVRVQVTTDTETIDQTEKNAITKLVEKYEGEDYCGEYQGDEYVSSYYIPWKKVEEFVKEAETIPGVNDVTLIPSLDIIANSTIVEKIQAVENALDGKGGEGANVRMVDGGLLISDLNSDQELFIEVDN